MPLRNLRTFQGHHQPAAALAGHIRCPFDDRFPDVCSIRPCTGACSSEQQRQEPDRNLDRVRSSSPTKQTPADLLRKCEEHCIAAQMGLVGAEIAGRGCVTMPSRLSATPARWLRRRWRPPCPEDRKHSRKNHRSGRPTDASPSPSLSVAWQCAPARPPSSPSLRAHSVRRVRVRPALHRRPGLWNATSQGCGADD